MCAYLIQKNFIFHSSKVLNCFLGNNKISKELHLIYTLPSWMYYKLYICRLPFKRCLHQWPRYPKSSWTKWLDKKPWWDARTIMDKRRNIAYQLGRHPGTSKCRSNRRWCENIWGVDPTKLVKTKTSLPFSDFKNIHFSC